jgi:DNA-binding IclR family transcriptional regulator
VTSQHILAYLSGAYQANPEAEVSGAELQRKLGLEADTVRRLVAELARQGLVEWDPLLSNIWLRITDKGLAAVRHAQSP